MDKSLFLLSDEEIFSRLSLEKPFQAKIISGAIVKGVKDFNLITSLSLSERERLKNIPILRTKVRETLYSPSALKVLIELEDGLLVEAVRLSDGKGRYTACLSSQVGCAVGCAFCKTGTMGLLRNLTASEIVEEFSHLSEGDKKISNIVFMGMGEPLENFSSLIEAIECFHRKDRWNISYRKITVSTSGFIPGIKKLKELSLPLGLALSLVSADDKTRSSLMRINNVYPVSELKKTLLDYQKTTGRRITLELCLLKGINTDFESAKKIAAFSKGLSVVINLIPWNPVEGIDFETPSEKEVNAFHRSLSSLSLNVTRRREKGRKIESACGQLATKN